MIENINLTNHNIDFVMNVTKSKKNFNSYNNENFRISKNIYFHDDIWDFNHLNKNNRIKMFYRYNFTTIPPQFTFILKHILINEIFFKKNSFGSVNNTFNMVSNFFKYMDNVGIKNVLLLNKKSVEDYLIERKKTVSTNRLESICSHICKIFNFLEEVTDYKYTGIINLLNVTSKSCRDIRDPYTAKNDYIPDSFLNQTISLAIKDMNDKNLSYNSRIVACLLIIMAETGMRAEEISLLESGMIDTINKGSKGKEVNYLKFKTFKTKSNIGEYKDTYCYLPEKSTIAYKTCEDLMNEVIDNLTELTKLRSLIILCGRGDEIPKNNRKITLLREILKTIPNNELQKSEKNLRKYLYINEKTGLQKRGSMLLRDNILSFYIRHKDDITLDNINQSDIDNLNKFMFTSESKFKKEFSVKQRKHIKYEDLVDEIYYYVNPHRFRVTVCTKLFANNVQLDYIVKHMNHLSEDMTIYYNKSHELKDELEESIKILSLMSKNSDGLIETNPTNIKSETYKSLLSDKILRENIDKINTFLQKNDLNILKDISIILKKLKKFSAPVAENDFGICISIVTQNICQKRDSFASELDLTITLPTYKNINYTYDLFKERVKVVNHNKDISTIDKSYYNEYKREVNTLKHLINTRLKKEVNLLQTDLDILGYDAVIEKYPHLGNIAKNISNISKEISKWK